MNHYVKNIINYSRLLTEKILLLVNKTQLNRIGSLVHIVFFNNKNKKGNKYNKMKIFPELVMYVI